MHKYSQKATSYVVMAHYAGEDRSVRSFTLGADTPIREVFAALWPADARKVLAGSRFAPIPFRIEIVPDEKSIPAVDEPDLFAAPNATAA